MMNASSGQQTYRYSPFARFCKVIKKIPFTAFHCCVVILLLIHFNESHAQIANCEGFVSSGGRKFWLAVPANPLGTGDPAIHINIVGKAGTTGSISIKDNSFNAINFTIPANGFFEVDLPAPASQVAGNQVILNKGILISGNDDFNVYVISEKQFTTEGYLGIPVNGLGLEYYVINFNGLGATAESQATIVASRDNTSITVTRPNGIIHNILLNEGQIYVIQDPGIGDLTGTRVVSDKPVAVFGSVKCANVPANIGTCDYIVEQMIPLMDWDMNYVVPPLPSDGQLFRVMAGANNTTVLRNGIPVAALNKGQFWTSTATSNPTAVTRFSSTNKIIVAQYATGNAQNGNTGPGFDPAFGLVPSQAIWLNKHIFKSQPNFTNNLLMVTNTTSTGSVTVNGSPISPAPVWTIVPGTVLSWTRIALAAGQVYTVENIDPIGLTVFGGKVDESYLLPGNMSLGDLDMDGVRNISDCDADGDGILNSVEIANALPGTNGDSDMDGIVDELDLDSDGDGIPDNIEAQSTLGYTVPTGTVNTLNGVDLAYPSGILPVDTDGDLIPDYLDQDSDGAGTNDLIETEITLSGIDADGDGLDDAVDTNDSQFGPANAGIVDVLNAYPNNGTEVNWRILGTMPPMITTGGGNASLTVNFTTLSTNPVIDYQATDPDGETENGGGLTWKIQGGADAALFTIDSNTGVLNFVNPPDFNAPIDAGMDNNYELIIEVKDATGEIDTQLLSVEVLLNVPPSILSSNTVDVSENESFVINVESTDDNDSEGNGLTYSLTGNLTNGPDESLFAIDANTGVLTFLNAPDYELPNDANMDRIYLVEIQVCDADVFFSTQIITINLQDEDEDGDGFTAHTPIIDTDDNNPCVPDNAADNCCEAIKPNVSKD